MGATKVFRDPVHNIVELDLGTETGRLLLALIDTPEVQRTRHVRQLGMANLVFHGAEHSRFGHSLGAMHVARAILDRISGHAGLSEVDRLTVLAAALLHDIGHGPFSHGSETLFGMPHEQWTVRIILDPDTGVHRVLAALDPTLPDRVAELVMGRGRPRFLARIVSGQLDCDRLDYILRDGWALGVDVKYDLARILGLLSVDLMEDRLVVDARGHDAVEAYLIARHHLYRNVYHHKTTRAAGAMFAALFRRAAFLVQNGWLSPPTSPGLAKVLAGEVPEVAHYLGLDDHVVWAEIHRWAEDRDPILSELAGGLLTRRLYKGVPVGLHDVQARRARKARVRDLIRAEGLDPAYHLLEDLARDQAYKPYSPDLGQEGIFLAWPTGTREISETSGLVRALFQADEDLRWFVPERVRGAVERLVR